MKKLISVMLVLMFALSLCVPVFAIRVQTDGAYTHTDSKTIIENEDDRGDSFYGKLESAKIIVEDYLRVNMKKYDPASKDELSYDNIIRADNPFKEYAEKLLIFTNNRYRCMNSIKLERVNYKIEYGDVSCAKGIITICADVLEEKKYENQQEYGYILTKHVFAVEQVDEMFYIADDKTDDYVDTYLREYGDKENCTIDDLIEDDKASIRESLKITEEELDSYLQANDSIGLGVAINQVESFYDAAESRRDTGADSARLPKCGSNTLLDEIESKETNSMTVTHHSFNVNNMYTYAASYNGASPTKISNRNPAYTNYDGQGGDCTNYISQILRAGGAPNDSTGNYQWYYYSSGNRSASWTHVNWLYTYLVNNNYIGPQGQDITSNGSYYAAAKGDVIQLRFSINSDYVHSLWITAHQSGTTACTTIACHTSDRWNEPLDTMSGLKRWIKLKGYDQ